MFKQMNVAMKLLGDCVSYSAVRQKFQFCLLGYFGGQRPNSLNICVGHSVWDEHRVHAREIETPDIRRLVSVLARLWRWRLNLFAKGLAIKRKRFQGEMVLRPFNLVRMEMGGVRNYLKAGCGFKVVFLGFWGVGPVFFFAAAGKTMPEISSATSAKRRVAFT